MHNNQYKFKQNNLFTLKSKLVIFRHSKFFSAVTTSVIIFYSIALGLKTYVDDIFILSIFSILDTLITLYFVFEISLKLYVEKNKADFFKDSWNLFDFIVVIVSIIPLEAFNSAAIGRLLRIFRVLRLISVNDNIKKLLTALEGAISSIVNIILLMFIVFYVYAILGNQFFGDLKSGLWVDFSTSMLTLFRILTLEDWTDVMYEAMEISPLSWIYFVSFVIINTFVIFNLFVAVIIQQISKIKDNDIQYALENENYEMVTITHELAEIKEQLIKIQREVKK